MQSRKGTRTKSPFRVPKEFTVNLSSYNGICSLHTTVEEGRKRSEVGGGQDKEGAPNSSAVCLGDRWSRETPAMGTLRIHEQSRQTPRGTQKAQSTRGNHNEQGAGLEQGASVSRKPRHNAEAPVKWSPCSLSPGWAAL